MASLLKSDIRDNCDFTCFEMIMLCGLSVPEDLIREVKVCFIFCSRSVSRLSLLWQFVLSQGPKSAVQTWQNGLPMVHQWLHNRSFVRSRLPNLSRSTIMKSVIDHRWHHCNSREGPWLYLNCVSNFTPILSIAFYVGDEQIYINLRKLSHLWCKFPLLLDGFPTYRSTEHIRHEWAGWTRILRRQSGARVLWQADGVLPISGEQYIQAYIIGKRLALKILHRERSWASHSVSLHEWRITWLSHP